MTESILPEGPIERPHVRSLEEAERWISVLHHRSITDGDRLMLLDLTVRRHLTPWWQWRKRQNLGHWIEVAKSNINSRGEHRPPQPWPGSPAA